MKYRRKPISQFFRNQLLLPGLLGLSLGVAADYLSDAQSYYEKKEFQSAIIQLKNELQKNSKNTQARFLLGQVYLASGSFIDAEKELKVALSLGSEQDKTQILLAKALLNQGKVDEALATLENKVFSNPDEHAEALAIQGHLYLAKNKLEDARASFKQAIELGGQAYALLGRARLALMEGEIDEGLMDIDKALTQDPAFIEALFTKGQVLASQDKFPEAIAVFSKIIKVELHHMGARLARAEAYIRLKQLDAARADVQDVLQQNEMQPHANFIMARLQLDAQEYPQAQTSAEKVLRMSPNHQLSFFVLGAAHYAQDNFEQAKIYLEKFIALKPTHITAARVLGATYLKLGDPSSAVDILETADQGQEHQDAQLLNVLGRAYMKMGEFEKGTAALNRAIQIEPNIEGAQAQIALANLAAGNTKEAIKQLEELNSKDASDEMTSIMLTLSYIKQGQFNMAFKTIDNAIKISPQKSNFYNLRGLVYEAQGDSAAARDAYQKALAINNKFIPVILSLAKLDFRENKLDLSAAKYQQVLAISPNHMQSLLALAQLAQANGDESKMLDWIKQARMRNPNALQPVEILVNYYLSKNELDKALNEARKFQTEHLDNVQIASALSRVHLAKGENEEAKHQLQKLINFNQKDLSHRMQMVQILMTEKQPRQALTFIDEILQLDERYLPALLAKSQLLISEKKFKDAESEIAKIEKWYVGSYLGQQLTGDLMLAKEQPEQALARYEQAFAQAKTAYLVSVLFEQYSAQGNWETAADRLQSYVDAVPQDAGNRLRLASVYQKLEQNQKAVELYEQLIEQVPNNPVVLNNLAWLYWLKQDQRSLDYAERALAVAPDKAEIADTLGWIMLHMGDKKKALEIIRDAASKAPTMPEIRYHLAVALHKNNQNEQAKKELTRLLRDYPGFSEEQSAKQLLNEMGEGR